jgi:hypothetical protein
MLAGAAAACVLAGSIAATGPATAAVSQSRFSCRSEQRPTTAYENWQIKLISQSSSAVNEGAAEHAPALASQPQWLAVFGSMTKDSRSSHHAGRNWFTWDNRKGKAYVEQAFAARSSYLIEARQDQLASSGVEKGWPAVPVTMQVYPSAWDLISALDPGEFGNTVCGAKLFSDVGAVMYDDEDWGATPQDERRYPGYYVAMIAYYVHQHNISHPAQPLKFFVAPSLDLSNTVVPANFTGSSAWSYLADDVPELVSTPSTAWNPDQDGGSGGDGNFGSYKASDVEIQAQQDELVVTGTVTPAHVTYQYLVRQAAGQIAVRDPGATVFAGLTTNNTGGNGAEATVAQVQAAASKVHGAVSGFWLNDPTRSSKCLRCTGTYPNIADGSLNAIDNSLTW